MDHFGKAGMNDMLGERPGPRSTDTRRNSSAGV